jgi:sigma-B regulation protein RsbU (phosphoserine phosphatase)
LGIAETIPFVDLEILEVKNDFTLFCYTDGLTDTLNTAGHYISENAIKDIISKNTSSQPKFINDAIMYYAEEFKGENLFDDDIALLTIKCA